MSIDLTGKVAIVTGSSRGIGREIAHTLSKHGAYVMCCGTQQEATQAVATYIEADTKHETLALQVDVSQSASIQNMVKQALEKWGRVDILVNNAGITRDNLLLRLSDEDWDAVIHTNLNSVFYAVKASLKPMLKQRFGRIINIASVVGIMGNAGQANYAAAKAGIIGFSKTVAKEYGAKGITCNVVAPGFIQTDMISALPKEYLDTIMATVPQRRLGTPQDVANAVLFLASDLASYITGQVIQVDGGIRT